MLPMQFWLEAPTLIAFLGEITNCLPSLLLDALTGALAVSCVVALMNLITMIRGDRT